jgi:ATP-dependent RNA helicase SUPV3L1/SUV3
MGSDLEARIRHVTAVLGPTNTGKTHLAIERMVGHESGMIGLPLRLLAREVYDKISAKVGADAVALITGEEKIKPERARYWVCTVEAMPRDVDVDFLAIDEVQLAGDPERGHVFTDRLLHARGKAETLLLGAQTMREAIADLVPGCNFISRPRLSKLTYSGQKKITRLPQRSAVVAFSAADVYSIAELIRRQRGGAAVVLGALSPRTRNAQVALYQSGDVDFLIATDAVGMGLNLDVDHIAFSAARKFDGQNFRNLTPAELSQIAGRAGRHLNDGTFGVTGACEPFEADVVERLETHNFDSVRLLQWRNRSLDFSTLEGLKNSLRETPNLQRLTRARAADDVVALETVSADKEIAAYACAPAAIAKLWDVCQVPDYRKISGQSHSELVASIYKYLMSDEERIPEDWFAKQVAYADRTDGDIDTLANRIAHIRTWTFVSNRADWLKDPAHWQGRTREIEDKLSDALHECLTQRFVDLRTSALVKGMRDKDELNAEIGEDGSVHVENHFVGRLRGFRFTPDVGGEGIHGKAKRNAAAQVLARELAMRARRVAAAQPDAFRITPVGCIIWKDEEIAQLEATDDPLKPSVSVLADEHLSTPDREKVQARIETWVTQTIAERFKPLVEAGEAEDVSGLARGIAFRLRENLGILKRETVADEIKSLDQTARGQLRKYGVRFGAFNIYFPLLLKPAAAELALTLWSLKQARDGGVDLGALPQPPRAGLTSFVPEANAPEGFYRAYGYHLCGPRAVRIDMLERLADLIRPLLAFRADPEKPAMPPNGATGDGGFTVTPEMMSLLGCSPEELSNVLKALGFRLERRPVRSETAPVAETAEASGSVGEAGSEAAQKPAAASEPVPTEASDAPAAEPGPAEPADVPATEPEVATAGESSAPETAESAAQADAAPAEAKEPEFEEVWRPRRRPRAEQRREGAGRGRRREPQKAEQADKQPEAASAAKGNGHAAPHAPKGADARGYKSGRRSGAPGDRGDRPQGGQRRRQKGGPDKRHREERRKPEVHSAAPPAKGGREPDSPFAALGELRDALTQRERDKENSST